MREWYISKEDNTYECPYCHTEITYYYDDLETHEEECNRCGREFRLVVIYD